MRDDVEIVWREASAIVILTDLSYDMVINGGSSSFIGGLDYKSRPIISKASMIRKCVNVAQKLKNDDRPHIQNLVREIENLNPQYVDACFNLEDTGNTLGCTFFGFEDELIIYAAGFVSNKYGFQNLKDLTFQSPIKLFNYFECFGYYTFTRFANDFHIKLCSLLIKNKNIKKLTFVGYSYGSVFATIFSFFYQQLLNFYNTPETMTDEEKDFVSKFYAQFVPALEDKKCMYSNMIRGIANLKQIDTNDATDFLDSSIFTGRTLNKVWVIASPALLTESGAQKYNDALGDKYIHIKLRNGDAVPDILSTSCWMYKLQFNHFFGPGRQIIGHSIIINNVGRYSHTDYAKACMEVDIKECVYVKSCDEPVNSGYIEFMKTVYLSSTYGLNSFMGSVIVLAIVLVINIIPLTMIIVGFMLAFHSALWLLLGLAGFFLFISPFI